MGQLPGVKVGPLDPDATKDFGQVAQKNSARTLIRLHARAHPPELVRALARPIDPERTKGLVLEEVRGYLMGEERENGDPLVPKGSRVVGAAVRGDRDTAQTLTFTYRTSSGRTGKWFTEYDPSEIPESAKAGDELVAVKELRERGVVAFDSEGASTELLRRRESGLRRENEALRSQLDQRDGKGKNKRKASEIPTTETDARPDVAIVEENEDLRRQVEELAARNRELESRNDDRAAAKLREDAEAAAERQREAERTALEADEPVEGYDDLNAREVVKLLKDEDTAPETRQAILDFERAHAGRRSVVSAAEGSLGRS